MPNGGASAGSGGHLGELQVEMIAANHRDISTSEMQRRWRAALPPIAGVAELAFQNAMVSSGKTIELELRGNDLAQLRRAAAWLKGEIAQYPGVVAALSPYHAVHFMTEHVAESFVVLGAVVLCVTGAEAMYADMGHFGKGPVRIAWFGLVAPALVLNYFGQGALLIVRPDAVSSPFFLLLPA